MDQMTVKFGTKIIRLMLSRIQLSLGRKTSKAILLMVELTTSRVSLQLKAKVKMVFTNNVNSVKLFISYKKPKNVLLASMSKF